MTAPTAKTTPIMAETLVNAAQSKIAPGSALSTVTAARRGDSGTSAGRAARAPLVSADTTTAETPGAFLHAGNPVSAAVVEGSVAAGGAAAIRARSYRTRVPAPFF